MTDGIKSRIRELIMQSGAVAVGFAQVAPTTADYRLLYEQWIQKRQHAGMKYMEEHSKLRFDPSELLHGAKSIICVAYQYADADTDEPEYPLIARYALGRDYHKAIRSTLRCVCSTLRQEHDAETRICIDSAPIAERYWARKAGIGVVGRNGVIIVSDVGARCFLAEILTTLPLTPDKPATGNCMGCGRCIVACPTGALQSDGTIDSRRCLSYLTIEHRGPFTEEQKKILRNSRHKPLFGCDCCVAVCPHNKCIKSTLLPDFRPRPQIQSLTPQRVMDMTDEEFGILTQGSPLRRAGLDGLQRNAAAILES